MKILVCGGRDFNDHQMMDEALSHINFGLIGQHKHTIIHGCAHGADRMAGQWATSHGHDVEEYPADWVTNGKKAGYIRNVNMLILGKPDIVITFPGGKGTAMMIDLAINAKVKVMQVTRDQQGDVQMGTLGASSQTSKPRAFRTKKYEQMFIDYIQNYPGTVPTGTRNAMFADYYQQEIDWLANMDKEYNEIMQAEEAMDGIQKGRLG